MKDNVNSESEPRAIYILDKQRKQRAIQLNKWMKGHKTITVRVTEELYADICTYAAAHDRNRTQQCLHFIKVGMGKEKGQ
tara:strand:+ start:149 stop:388 length:240 start_codon:yes stop_codon:yes gene_type:complete